MLKFRVIITITVNEKIESHLKLESLTIYDMVRSLNETSNEMH